MFTGNLAYNIRYPSQDATQDYGYVEQLGGLSDIGHLKNDYRRNRVRPAKFQAHGGKSTQVKF